MKQENEEANVQLRTEEVNELLTTEPRWIYRWGILIIFVIMICGLMMSRYISYADALTAKTTVTTYNPPATIVSKTDGKIIMVGVQNNQYVKRGDVLMAIDNSADYRDVLKLAALADTFRTYLLKNLIPARTINVESLTLGPLTGKTLEFTRSYEEYFLFAEMNPQDREIKIIDDELKIYEALIKKYETQENIGKQEHEYVQKEFERVQSLFKNGSVTEKEYETKYLEFLSSKRSYENIRINTLNNEITLNNLKKAKLKLSISARTDLEKHKQAVHQSVQDLQSAISSWKETYLVCSPIDGRVSLFSYWTVNQNIRQGDAILSVIPPKRDQIIARLTVPAQNSGKLKIGQLVNIKLDNYPYQEYGMLKGRVKQISVMPKDNSYQIEVSLPEKLKTSYKKDLDYKEEMQGVAEIITEDLTVFDRILYQFKKLSK